MKKKLTKAEEQVMQALWKVEKGFLKEILDEMPEPKIHSNTLATILKILVDKKFVGVTSFGRLYQYYPLVKKDDYSTNSIRSLVEEYFNGSFSSIISFMVSKNDLSVDDLDTLVKQLKKQKK